MARTIIAASIIAIGLAAMGFFIGGRYSMLHIESNTAIRLDRFTGDVLMCVPGATKGEACGFVWDPEPADPVSSK